MLGTGDRGNKRNNEESFNNYLAMVKNKMNDNFDPISNKFSSLQNSTSGKRLFSEIQRDIASWRIRLQKTNQIEASTHNELFYIDKTRALAVTGGGEMDLLNQVSRLEKKMLNSGNSQVDLSWDIHYKEGLLNFKKGSYDLALKCFDEAIRKENDHEEAYIYRSKTFLALNQPKKALEDSEKAISINRTSHSLLMGDHESISSKKLTTDLERLDFYYIRALTGKAEALYAMKEFEKALMFYYRSLFRRSNCPIIIAGIRKTILSLQNCCNDQNFKGYEDLDLVIQKIGYPRRVENKLDKYITRFRFGLAPILEDEEKKKMRNTKGISEKWRRRRQGTSCASPTNKKAAFGTAQHLTKDIKFIKKLMRLGVVQICRPTAVSTMEFLADRKSFWHTQGHS
ncbi:outer dynein arm-docking complex subunit 4 [Lepeophtheirus salmonis]|nr:outer dynein arm-docking complex subunit 4-like [Lepeophtheirus salmonis]